MLEYSGILEYWARKLGLVLFVSLFHHSIIPLFQLFPAFHFSRRLGYRWNFMQPLLMNIYRTLYRAYGPRHWWPGETSFEVMVGAVLTQNTSWRNVEKAIQKLKGKGVLNPEGIHHLKKSQLASLIKSSGYYRIKADRLKAFVNFLYEEFDGELKKMRKGRLGRVEGKTSLGQGNRTRNSG